MERSYDMPYLHYHDHLEIYYLLKGNRKYFIRDSFFHISPGNLVVIKENELHQTFSLEQPQYERILINFRKSYLNDLPVLSDYIDLFASFNQSRILQLNAKEQGIVERLLFTMLDEQAQHIEGSNLYLKLLLIELMFFIHRYKGPLVKSHSQENLSPNHAKILDVVRYLNQNYNTHVSLDSLTKSFFISYHYLSRIFKNVMGVSITQYVNQIRVKQAQILLRETKKSVTFISEEVGYDSPTHFERNFKRFIGLSPLKYRKLYR